MAQVRTLQLLLPSHCGMWKPCITFSAESGRSFSSDEINTFCKILMTLISFSTLNYTVKTYGKRRFKSSELYEVLTANLLLTIRKITFPSSSKPNSPRRYVSFKFWLGNQLLLAEVPHSFLQTIQENIGGIPPVGHGNFLSNTCECIIDICC